jgi:hypothetical protein
MSDERYQRGWDKLKEVDGEAGERVMESHATVDKANRVYQDCSDAEVELGVE